MQRSTTRQTVAAPLTAIVGGALLAVGSFLDWAQLSVRGFGSASAQGTDGTDGWITFVAGLVVVACGLAWLLGRTRRPLGMVAIVAGLIGAGLGLYDALTAEDRVIDEVASRFATTLSAPVAAVKLALHQAIRTGLVHVSVRLGLYLVIVGGLAAVVAGMLGLMAQEPVPVTAPAGAMEPPMAADAPPTTEPAPPPTESEGSP